MSKKMLCPNCEKETLVEPVSEERMVEVKGEKLPVKVNLWRCLDCKEEFEDPAHPIDELDLAYREYRARHKMLQPEQVRELREEWGLTQAEFSRLLGWIPATLSRYENGALQEASHDNALQFLHEPFAMLSLLNRSGGFLSHERMGQLQGLVLEKLEHKPSDYLIGSLELREPDIYSGNTRFDFNKYRAVLCRIVSRCGGGVPKTKLNKLFYYSDSLNFKRRGKSITGSVYIHMPYGPCPDDFQSLLGILADTHFIEMDEVELRNQDYNAEIIKVKGNVEESILEDEEKAIIDEVCRKLGDRSSTDLTELSHAEKGYQLTGDREAMSYEYAKYLNIN